MINRLALFVTSLAAFFCVAPDASGATYKTPYSEPVAAADTTRTGAEWQALGNNMRFSWANKDVHYRHADLPSGEAVTDTAFTVWRGERVGLMAIVSAGEATGELRPELTGLPLKGSKGAWKGSGASWMRYVLTDEYDRCGDHPDSLPAYTVPDIIDLPGALKLDAHTSRPVWVTLEVPRDIRAGRHTADLSLVNEKGKKVATLKMDITVADRTLPEPSEQAFHLNLWQQPYSVSRYYEVPRWSDRHFELLAPYVQALARAGQSTISAVLFYEPWGEQSNDKFDPMVETVRNADGTWSYDYTVFDRWVEFCGKNGLNGLIECFTMIPWEMNFRYLDAPTGEYKFIKTTTDSPEYADLWGSFIKAFYAHVSEKGWADRTIISMDERALPDMLNAYRIAQEAAPGIKMALAGTYHPEVVDKVYTYSLTAGDPFPAEALKSRRDKGLISTYYTCCSSPKPNYFSNNRPSDAAYIPVYCTATGADGYLHWSFMNWTDDPMTDTRFKLFAPGDTYFYYPDNRSSVRFERLIEGVQLSEKLRMLRAEAMAAGDVATLAALEEALLPVRTGLTSGSVTTGDVVRNLQYAVSQF
ncbi:MAG: DUF4091 domain-containing protein [Paramuribaculum sp.]|nr:DUF4091 domain-containing protein [Paramuribaculum sp.]